MGSLKKYYQDHSSNNNNINHSIKDTSSDDHILNQTIKVRIVKEDGQEVNVGSLTDKRKIVIVINNQFTSAPNTTQIASGAGRNSAAGNNAAIDSSNTEQQQSVGAKGDASNSDMGGNQVEPHKMNNEDSEHDEIVIVINNQVNRTSTGQASVTQVASGSGDDSAAGTNAAIESSNTKQQHAVGGDGTAENSGEDGDQTEE